MKFKKCKVVFTTVETIHRNRSHRIEVKRSLRLKAKKISSNIIISLKDAKSGDLCLGSKKENDRNVKLLRAGEQVMSSGGSRGGPPLIYRRAAT